MSVSRYIVHVFGAYEHILRIAFGRKHETLDSDATKTLDNKNQEWTEKNVVDAALAPKRVLRFISETSFFSSRRQLLNNDCPTWLALDALPYGSESCTRPRATLCNVEGALRVWVFFIPKEHLWQSERKSDDKPKKQPWPSRSLPSVNGRRRASSNPPPKKTPRREARLSFEFRSEGRRKESRGRKHTRSESKASIASSRRSSADWSAQRASLLGVTNECDETWEVKVSREMLRLSLSQNISGGACWYAFMVVV